MIKAWFISDIHLKNEQESNSEKLLLFLHSLEIGQRQASHLFLVGDIFDLWIHNHSYFIEKFPKIVNAIGVVVKKGIEVHYFEGNHDLYLKKYWQQDVGVKVHEGPEFFNLGSYKVRVEHGDLMNPDDKGYLFLKSVLASKPVKVFAHNIPGALVSWIGERASQASRHYTSHQKSIHEHQVRKYMNQYVKDVYPQAPFDYFVAGHTHHRDVQKIDAEGEEVTAINLGSWFDEPQALLIDDQGHQFITL